MTEGSADGPSPTNHTLLEDQVLLEDWPLRPWILAAIGAFAGLGVYELLDGFTAEPWRAAFAALLFFGAAAAGFVLRPQNLVETAAFALIVGAVMGGIAYLAVNAGDSRAGEEFAFAAGVFFSILAIPLFQADFHRKRWATPYAETHFHVWTDAVSASGAFLFMNLSGLLLLLIHGLFSLVGIEVIEQLIETGWFIAMFAGATFGAALGVLRNQLGIIGTLQRVVMLVFALLAVPFALAILTFLVILLFSGGGALWEATDSATPVLLTCAVGCFILTNSVVRDDDEQRSSNIAMRAAALVLAACILPLAIFAAISMGIRIDQHGLSPERIWALIAIVISCLYGVAYWAGLARGRMAAWSEYLRRANLHLAVVTCGVALILAFPLLDFGAISARDQIARLQSGEATVEDFDYAALRWDFGAGGRDALEELTSNPDAQIAQLAQDAQLMENRPYGGRTQADRREIAEAIDFGDLDESSRVAVAAYVRDESYLCSENCRAVSLGQIDRGELIALLSEGRYDGRKLLLVTPDSERAVEQHVRDGRLRTDGTNPVDSEGFEGESEGESGEVELRAFEGQQLYIDGKPASQPFK